MRTGNLHLHMSHTYNHMCLAYFTCGLDFTHVETNHGTLTFEM